MQITVKRQTCSQSVISDCEIWSFRSATHVGALAHVKELKHKSNHESNSVHADYPLQIRQESVVSNFLCLDTTVACRGHL